MAREIPLTRGKVAIVDDRDYERVAQYKWCAHYDSWNWYAVRSTKINGRFTLEKMHRYILGLTKGDKKRIDHQNGNGLDNRKENLRLCSAGQNAHNRRKYRTKNPTSHFKGVFRSRNKWHAEIMVKGVTIRLGAYSFEEVAALAYDLAALKYFREFAVFNF